jgi:hypothetical protein
MIIYSIGTIPKISAALHAEFVTFAEDRGYFGFDTHTISGVTDDRFGFTTAPDANPVAVHLYKMFVQSISGGWRYLTIDGEIFAVRGQHLALTDDVSVTGWEIVPQTTDSVMNDLTEMPTQAAVEVLHIPVEDYITAREEAAVFFTLVHDLDEVELDDDKTEELLTTH